MSATRLQGGRQGTRCIQARLLPSKGQAGWAGKVEGWEGKVGLLGMGQGYRKPGKEGWEGEGKVAGKATQGRGMLQRWRLQCSEGGRAMVRKARGKQGYTHSYKAGNNQTEHNHRIQPTNQLGTRIRTIPTKNRNSRIMLQG